MARKSNDSYTIQNTETKQYYHGRVWNEDRWNYLWGEDPHSTHKYDNQGRLYGDIHDMEKRKLPVEIVKLE